MSHAGLRPPLAISLLIHAAVFALAAPLVFTAVAPGRQPTLLLTIVPPAAWPAEAKQSPVRRPAALPLATVTQPVTVERAAEATARVSAPAPAHVAIASEPESLSRPAERNATAQADESAAATSEPPATGPAESSAQEIMGRLHSAVQTHFYYPPLARRKGWEGQVTVGVRVQSDGRLTDIRVIESSGHRILDGAAVDCLIRAARLTGVRHSIGAGMELVLPVKYLLIDSPA